MIKSITKKTNKSHSQKVRKSISEVFINIYCTFNNSIVSLTDIDGNVIAISSAGGRGYKSSKKATPHAMKDIIKYIFEFIDKYKVKNISAIKIKGSGTQLEQGLTSVMNEAKKREINVSKQQDLTPIPHNGTRPRKLRRS